jgi:hypothetical protein
MPQVPDDDKYVLGSERDLRNVILLLVKAVERSRRNLMGANMAIHAISSMSPDERKALTSAQIATELKSVQQQLAQQRDPAVTQIEKVLNGDGEFLEHLRVFASQLHW